MVIRSIFHDLNTCQTHDYSSVNECTVLSVVCWTCILYQLILNKYLYVLFNFALELIKNLGGCHYLSAWGVTFFSEDFEKKWRPPLLNEEKNDDPPTEWRKTSRSLDLIAATKSPRSVNAFSMVCLSNFFDAGIYSAYFGEPDW